MIFFMMKDEIGKIMPTSTPQSPSSQHIRLNSESNDYIETRTYEKITSHIAKRSRHN